MFISSNCNISIFGDVSQFFTCSCEGLKKSRKVIQITKLKREFYLNFHWTLLLALGFVSLKESVCNESSIDTVNYMISIERVVKNEKKKKKKKKKQLRKQNLSHITQSQVTFTCSKSTIETLEKTWNMLKVNYYCQVWTNFTPFSNCFYCSLWISKCQLGSLFAILKLFSPKSFLMFSGGTNKQHRAVMG